MADQRLDRRRILTGAGALGALGALAALQSQTPARADGEQGEDEEHRRSLIGAWEFTAIISVGVAATPTSTPMGTSTATPMGTTTPTPSGTSLILGLGLIAPHGVALFTDQSEPSQHVGLGVGAWDRTGQRTFALTFRRQQFDATGALVGTTTIWETLTLDAAGDTFSGSGSVSALDLMGTVVSSGSFTVQGTRITVQAVGVAATPTGTAMGTATGTAMGTATGTAMGHTLHLTKGHR